MSNIVTNYKSFPKTGNIDDIYIDIETGISYRWNNTSYSPTIPVAGELYSASTEGVLGSAKNIYDFKKQKNQQQINEDLEFEILNLDDKFTEKLDNYKLAVTTINNNPVVIFENDNDKFFASLTKLVGATFPDIQSTYNVLATANYVTISLNGGTYDSLELSYDQGESWTNNRNIQWSDNGEIQNASIRLKAVYNEVITVQEIDTELTFIPKIYYPSNLFIKNNNDIYDSQASITIKRIDSIPNSLNIEYSIDGGNTWEDLTKDEIINFTSSSNYSFKIKYSSVEGSYSNRNQIFNFDGTITLNTPKTYWGISNYDFKGDYQQLILTLTAGGSIKASSISSNTLYSFNQQNVLEDSYVWILCTSQIQEGNIFHKASDVIPAGFLKLSQIGPYYVYRSIEKWQRSSIDSIYLKK